MSHSRPTPGEVRHATRASAWASFLEDERGMVRAGLAADVVLLDRDPFAEGADSLLDTRVQCTIVAGRVVYRTAPTDG